MPFIKDLSNVSDLRRDLWQAKSLYKVMLGAPFWTQLGEVAAGDIFNGNNDRFSITRLNDDLGKIVNFDNIMFRNAMGNKFSVTGSDTFDHSSVSSSSNLTSTMTFDKLKILTNDVTKRRKFSKNCVESLFQYVEDIIDMEKASFLLKYQDRDEEKTVSFKDEKARRDFRMYATNWLDGAILNAAKKLQTYVVTKILQRDPRRAIKPEELTKLKINKSNEKPIPAGVIARAVYLGWVQKL
jgi:hypothetical protein